MNNKYKILKSSDKGFYSYIDRLWENQKWKPYIYSNGSLEYYKQLTIDDNLSAEDVSFLVLFEDTPVLLFIGALIKGIEQINLMAFKAPCTLIIDSHSADCYIADLAWKQINHLLQSVNGTFEFRDFVQHGLLTKISTNLLQMGASTKTQLFQLIDLRYDETELWRNIRKSYKSLINSGSREIEVDTFDSKNITWKDLDRYRLLHAEVAGRETRSINSWQKQFEWIRNGEAFMLTGKINGEVVTTGLFTHTKSICTYFSSASKRALFKKPIFHTLLWKAILKSKLLGCTWFDLNEKYFDNFPALGFEDRKLISISDFKVGFGGNLKPIIDFSLNIKN